MMKHGKIRSLSLFLAFAIVISSLSGCLSGVARGTGKIEPPQQSSSAAPQEGNSSGEFPSAQSKLPQKAESSSSKAESKPVPQASSKVESSSEPQASSKAESSSEQPQVSSKAEPIVVSSAAESVSASAAESTPESALQQAAPENEQYTYAPSTASVPDEVRAIWISYLDFYSLAQYQNKTAFTANMNSAFEKIADYGLNTVFVQVRPFGDAMYDSDIFPWSYVLTGDEGGAPGYDPLAIMCSLARDNGLRIEAWINPYRVRATGSSRELSTANPAVKAVNSGSSLAIAYNGGIFYNPASSEARDLITRGVTEIIDGYDIDGIHFDDYFYPTTDMSFDSKYYKQYTSSGGRLSQADWRRENVNALVRQVYAAVKNTDSSVLFGISPQARMDNNYDAQFADVEKWLSEDGYVDYICPQIYYGFDNDTVPYSDSLALWNKMAKAGGTQLYVGLAVYKCGVSDKWAGGGINEWINSTTMLRDMVSEARDKAAYSGFVLYRYDSLFNPESAVRSAVSKERSNLKSIL